MIVLTAIARQSANAHMARTLSRMGIAFDVAAASLIAFTGAASMTRQEVTEAGRTLFARTSGYVGQAVAFAGRAIARSALGAVWVAVAF